MAAGFLELETQIGRRFREDSVTDIIIASLLSIGGSNATVFTPPEVTTGGDFDLVIYNPAATDGVQYRIQAKRLVSNGKNWSWSSYRELDHPHGTGKQASTLVRSSAQEKVPTIPLYAFYNPLGVCEASNNEIAGIQLADGRAINAIVRALVQAKAKGRRPRWKRVEYLRPLFFPLSTILCTPNDGTAASAIIGPEVSRRAALAAIADRRIEASGFDYRPLVSTSGTAFIGKLPPPGRSGKSAGLHEEVKSRAGSQQRREIPKIIERAIARTTDQPAIQFARIKRPKLILLSR